jgi:hypothetical protein
MIDEEERRDEAREKTDERKKMRSGEKQPRKRRRQDGDWRRPEWGLLVFTSRLIYRWSLLW